MNATDRMRLSCIRNMADRLTTLPGKANPPQVTSADVLAALLEDLETVADDREPTELAELIVMAQEAGEL